MALIHFANTTNVTITATDTASVVTDVSPISMRVSQSLMTVPLKRLSSTSGDLTPSMPASWPSATWTPTPVIKPTRTVREMKSARNPRRATLATSSNPPVISAARLAYASHWSVSGCRPATPSPAIPANRIAAVAESPPTTRCRDEPKSANAIAGNQIVYRPVMTGVPAIFVYPITSGIASAANVIPATTSRDSSRRS
jgi:hypothetical protein